MTFYSESEKIEIKNIRTNLRNLCNEYDFQGITLDMNIDLYSFSILMNKKSGSDFMVELLYTQFEDIFKNLKIKIINEVNI